MWFVGQVRHNIWPCNETEACAAGLDWSILWYDISSGKGTWGWVPGMLEACIGQVHLKTAAWKLAGYKLDLVGIQEVRWDKGSIFRSTVQNSVRRF